MVEWAKLGGQGGSWNIFNFSQKKLSLPFVISHFALFFRSITFAKGRGRLYFFIWYTETILMYFVFYIHYKNNFTKKK